MTKPRGESPALRGDGGTRRWFSRTALLSAGLLASSAGLFAVATSSLAAGVDPGDLGTHTVTLVCNSAISGSDPVAYSQVHVNVVSNGATPNTGFVYYLQDDNGNTALAVPVTSGSNGKVVIDGDYNAYSNAGILPNYGYSDGLGSAPATNPPTFLISSSAGTNSCATPPVNNPPKANDDTATTDENTPVTVDVLANDTDKDGDTLSVATFDSTSGHGGTVTLVSNKLKYTPASGFTGTDTFGYTAGDGKDGSNKATVTVTVNKAKPSKVFVCKYVGKPGVDERLQTGQNPIEVSINAIPEDPVVIGSYFADAQGRSYVLHYVDGVYSPTREDCPAGDTPPPPPCVTLSSDNVAQYGSLVWTGTSATVTLRERDGGYCNDWTFDVTRYAPAAFPQTVKQVSAASVGKSGLSATASVYDTDCGQIDGYEGSGPEVGSTLHGPGQDYEANHKFLSQVFGTNYNTWKVASDGCETPPPPPTKVDVPAQPSVTDACGPGNATWKVPVDTDSVVWTLQEDGHLIASTTPGYEFTDGTTSHDYGVAPDSNTPCPVPAQPKVDVSTDSCVMPGATDGPTTITVTNTADDTHATVEDYVVAVTSPGMTNVTLHTGPLADGASKTLTVLGLQPGTYGVTVTGSDKTGASISFTLTACSPPPPPQKTVVTVNIAATGANCGPKAIETFYVGGQLNKVTYVVTVAGHHVGLSSTNSFTVDSGQKWSVVFTVKDSANNEFANGTSTETFSAKNAEKPFACPVPPRHHHPHPTPTPTSSTPQRAVGAATDMGPTPPAGFQLTRSEKLYMLSGMLLLLGMLVLWSGRGKSGVRVPARRKA